MHLTTQSTENHKSNHANSSQSHAEDQSSMEIIHLDSTTNNNSQNLLSTSDATVRSFTKAVSLNKKTSQDHLPSKNQDARVENNKSPTKKKHANHHQLLFVT